MAVGFFGKMLRKVDVMYARHQVKSGSAGNPFHVGRVQEAMRTLAQHSGDNVGDMRLIGRYGWQFENNKNRR